MVITLFPSLFKMILSSLCFVIFSQRSHGLFSVFVSDYMYGLSLARLRYHLRNDEVVILVASCRAEWQRQFLSHFPFSSRHVLIFLSYTKATPSPASFHASLIPQTVTLYEKLQFPLLAAVFVVPDSFFHCHVCLVLTSHKIQRSTATVCFSLGVTISV